MTPAANHRSLPKVVLHEHLDGGLRVETILELADECGYTGLPANDAAALGHWFDQGRSGSLDRYLQVFVHTVAVMQTAEAIERVAFEAVEDLAADGVIYAEIRFAPSLLTQDGLSLQEVMGAALAGMARGEAKTGLVTRYIADAMRQETDSAEVATAAIDLADPRVVGFDLAGPEDGYPADDHLEACNLIRQANLGLTIHAGEDFGPDSIWRALQLCGAHRIGHGIHIVDDCVVEDGHIVSLGSLASYVRNHQVPLEICPTSNLHTAGWQPDEHPIGALHRAGFNVSVNTDNRLMSRITMSGEFDLLAEHQGFGIGDFHAVTWRALDAAFCDWDTKQRLLAKVDAGYVEGSSPNLP